MREYIVSSKDAIRSSHSNGWLMKWNIGDKWLKSPGYICYYMWDTYSEAIASCIATDLGINRHLNYKLCILNIDGVKVIGCESNNYKESGYIELTIQKMIDLKYIADIRRQGQLGYEQLIKDINRIFNINIRGYLEDIMLLDSIILNTDRNAWNISIQVDRNMQGHECKIYDSGNSLCLAGYKEGEFWEESMYSNGIHAEPFSIYFEEQVKYIRNCRNYSGNLVKTNKLLRFIENNLMDYNNTYKVQNTLSEKQLIHLKDLIYKRYKRIIENKAWIS